MAERRMFSKEVTESDAFLDMPSTTQNLYFHLGMNADDEGFISSPKKILRYIGGNQNDLDILLSKRYVIGFDSGIVVVKHWKLNNAIRKDRLKETVYTEEKALLLEKENGVYTLDTASYEELQPNDNQMTTKCPHRLGKDRLGEVSLEPLEKPTKQTTKIVNNFKKWSIEDFTEEIKKEGEQFTSEMKNEFFSYWTEPDSKGKMKFQLQKTWCTSRRLSNWFSRSSK